MKLGLFLLAALSLQAGTINIFDGTFNAADWSSSLITNTNNSNTSFSTVQMTTGGGPTFFRKTTLTTTPDGSGKYNMIRVADVYTNFTLAAGTGITSIDYSFDLENLLVGQAYMLAIFQGSQVYLSDYPSRSLVATSGSWTTGSFTGLTSAKFCSPLDPNDPTFLSLGGQNCSSNHNFSGTGGAIQIGYVTHNGLPNGTTITGLDNFSVSINTATPEPASIGFAAIGLALFLVGKRRQSAGSNSSHQL